MALLSLCHVRCYNDIRLQNEETDSTLVANNFWGKEDAGVHPLLDRMQNAKATCDEVKAFYNGCEFQFRIQTIS